MSRAEIRKSDRKAAQLLGVTPTRDPSMHPPTTGLVNALRTSFGFLRKKHSAVHSYESDHVVWDVQNPFAPPDPSQAHVHDLIQAEIARTRRYESIGPLQSLPSVHDEEGDDSEDADDEDEDDSDDEDGDDEGEDSEYEDKPNPIVLPQLLPIPLRFITPSPPPSPTPLSSSDTDDKDLAQAYNDIVEAEERAARKAKRDALRSRLKALAILGNEASQAI